MKCVIFASAKIKNYEFLKDFSFEDSYIICADGGLIHTRNLGITPNLWMGDGDSLPGGVPDGIETLTFPSRKDFTDTDLAIQHALEKGYKDITVIGGLGGRIDHEFSNLCLLKKILDNGGCGTLMDENNVITMKNAPFTIEKGGMEYVSFFPFGGDVTHFSVSGMRYEAKDITLKIGETLGVSNCFDEGTKAEISFESGYLLVISSKDITE